MIPAVGSAISRSQPKSFCACAETWPSFVKRPSCTSSASTAFSAASPAAALIACVPAAPANADPAAEKRRRFVCSFASAVVAFCWTAPSLSLVAMIPSGMTVTPFDGGGSFELARRSAPLDRAPAARSRPAPSAGSGTC